MLVLSSEKALGLSLYFAKCGHSFLGNLTVTQHNTFLQQFQKMCLGIKMTVKDQLVFLGAPLGDAVKRGLLSTKIEKLDKLSNTVEHLDAH